MGVNWKPMDERNKTAYAVIKGLLIAQVLVGCAFIGFWLWAGEATIPKRGGGWVVLDRTQDPYLYWSLLIVFSCVIIAFPIRYLYQGPPKR